MNIEFEIGNQEESRVLKDYRTTGSSSTKKIFGTLVILTLEQKVQSRDPTFKT